MDSRIKELAEFEKLVDEVKGDCDKCSMDCFERLRIQGYQFERFEKAIQRFEIMVEALAEIVVQNHPDSFQRQLNELTARILAQSKQAKNDKGPHDEEKDLNKKLSDWN